jgi:serine/threonine protein kinase
MLLCFSQDLSANNVLLRTSATHPHGFTALVGDFSISRTVEDAKAHHVKPASYTSGYGTISYMAPETITHGVLDFACDVYAFGVLLWEMLAGTRAWAGLRDEQVLFYAGSGVERLPPLPGLPGPLELLLQGTLEMNPENRYLGLLGGLVVKTVCVV